MTFTRRKILAIGSSAIAFAGLSATQSAASLAQEAIDEFTGGAEMGEGALTLTAPEIAENGNAVPISFSAPGAVAVAIYGDGNPDATMAIYNFGPLNATRSALTRVRLAMSQNVIAVAQMEDGTFQTASAEVKVTIGGCGG